MYLPVPGIELTSSVITPLWYLLGQSGLQKDVAVSSFFLSVKDPGNNPGFGGFVFSPGGWLVLWFCL